MATSRPSKAEIQSLVSLIQSNTLLNRQLTSICQVNGLKSYGVKADLQRRIVDLIYQSVYDYPRFQQVKSSIDSARGGALPQYGHSHTPAPVHNHLQAPLRNMPTYTHQSNSQIYSSTVHQTQSSSHGLSQSTSRTDQSPMPWFRHFLTVTAGPGITFRSSPFYEPRALVADVKVCEPLVNHRSTTTVSLKAFDLQVHLSDDSVRILVFCSTSDTGIQDITFPHQSDIKVNGGEVKANLRGVKNKPGSTRPVDITQFLRLRPPGYINNVDFTYALTDKRYYLSIYACKSHKASELEEKIRVGKRIPRSSVVFEITREAQDTEIETTSLNMSLKCPLSYSRLKIPVRSTACKHIQCFDALSYLLLQEQGPQWICPICNNPAPFDTLAVDEYAREILESTSDSVEQVTIEPDGEWRLPGSNVAEPNEDGGGKKETSSCILDDEVVLSDMAYFNGRNTVTPSRSLPIPSTPNTARSREGSTMPPRSTTSAAGTKRTAAVIDLTLSDDDDDDNAIPNHPPAKRQNINGF